MCFVFIWEQTATCATYSINWLVFIIEMKSVYSAVRTGSLNQALCLKVMCTLVQALRLCTGLRRWGVEVQLYSFLTTALEGVRGQRHAPAGLYPRERPGTHCTGGWVGPRVGLDRCVKSRSHRDSIPDRLSRIQSLYRLSYPAHCVVKVKEKYFKTKYRHIT